MGIYFVDRKHGRHVDASFSLSEGGRLKSPDHYLVGDRVSVILEIDVQQQRAIEGNFGGGDEDDVRAYKTGGGPAMVHIPCEVVRRSHAIVWRSVGQFEELVGSSVFLKACTGDWEDVLLWLIRGTVPTWAKDNT